MSKIISVVVPVYNNKESLEETCQQIVEVHKNNFNHLILEMMFVNDGSKDGSWEELLRLQEIYKEKISLLNLSRNFGQLGAMLAGFNHAEGDAIICISADLQDPISLMARMVSYWEKSDTEIVMGYRQNRTDSFLARIFSKFAYFVARISYPELPKGGSDYWLMSKRASKILCSLKGRHNSLNGCLMSVGFSKMFIPYTRIQRKFGKSGWGFWKKFKVLVDFLVDTSYVPIRFMSALGVVTAFSGFLYSISITCAWFYNKTPFPGWAPIMIVSMIIGGIIMTMLGVLGEYIWRIYDNTKSFPFFIVDEKKSTYANKGVISS